MTRLFKSKQNEKQGFPAPQAYLIYAEDPEIRGDEVMRSFSTACTCASLYL